MLQISSKMAHNYLIRPCPDHRMEHHTTMPSILGPESGFERATRDRRKKPDTFISSLVFKAMGWAAIGLVIYGAYRFLIR